jgi:hypothetical protein
MLIEAAYLFALCWLLAQVEIQIEGGHGWADKLPTWRWSDARLLRVTNGKPLTGYHLFLTCFLLLFFHLPLLFAPSSRQLEAKIISFYFLMAIFWDFQWFVWNPSWGIRRFLKDHIWWYPKRVMRIPIEYFLFAAASFLSTAILWNTGIGEWFGLFAFLLIANGISLAAAEILRAKNRGNPPSAPIRS